VAHRSRRTLEISMNLLGRRMNPSGVSFSSFSSACRRSDVSIVDADRQSLCSSQAEPRLGRSTYPLSATPA